MPEGRLAAYVAPPHTGYAVEVYTFGLDGSNLRRVATTKLGAGYFGDMGVTWAPDGESLVYHDNNWDHTRTLFEVDLATLATSRLIDEPLVEDERWPLFSPDGEWVLFNGGDWSALTAWRVRADGTDAQPIGPEGALHPAMSPDGSRIAYQFGESLYVMNLETGAETPLGATGWLPVWAPDGDEIYYTARESDYEIRGRVRAVHPDGSGNRAVSATAIDWRVTVSPDGEWLVGKSAEGPGLLLIDADTGAELPLALVVRTGDGFYDTRTFSAPAWGP